jgi:hypothetical protein
MTLNSNSHEMTELELELELELECSIFKKRHYIVANIPEANYYAKATNCSGRKRSDDGLLIIGRLQFHSILREGFFSHSRQISLGAKAQHFLYSMFTGLFSVVNNRNVQLTVHLNLVPSRKICDTYRISTELHNMVRWHG